MARSDVYLANYLHKTHEVPRPTERDERWRRAPEYELDAAQEAWDRARNQHEQTVAMYATNAAKYAQNEAEQRAQRAAQQAQARANADQRILEPAWRAFQSTGGTAEEFEAVKPQLLSDARVKAALDAATGVTAEQARPPSLAGRW